MWSSVRRNTRLPSVRAIVLAWWISLSAKPQAAFLICLRVAPSPHSLAIARCADRVRRRPPMAWTRRSHVLRCPSTNEVVIILCRSSSAIRRRTMRCLMSIGRFSGNRSRCDMLRSWPGAGRFLRGKLARAIRARRKASGPRVRAIASISSSKHSDGTRRLASEIPLRCATAIMRSRSRPIMSVIWASASSTSADIEPSVTID